MELIVGDCLEWMRQQPDKSVDLVLTSPPYEDARTYGIGFKLKGEAFINWCVERYVECYRISRGLVAWVIEGKTRKFQYSAVPILLAAELHKRGVKLRKPPIFHRVGIPGSGGKEWLRNDYEFVICASDGKLSWSDNTACGAAPKYGPGGELSHRLAIGDRRRLGIMNKTTSGHLSGDTSYRKNRSPMPLKANPGNVIRCKVGGGQMGHKCAHENEAPFPLSLAEFFVKSFCPPDGTVLDPFCGSGTTLHAAMLYGRKGIGIDVRQSQIDLTRRRLADVGQTV